MRRTGLLTSQSATPTAATALPAAVAKLASSPLPTAKLLFLRSPDAHPLWLYFFRTLESLFRHRYGIASTWLCMGEPETAATREELDLTEEVRIPPRLRSVAAALRRYRPHVVHALGTRASVLCQAARLLVYPPPTLLSFPGEGDAPASAMERWLERGTRNWADRYVVADHEERDRLLRAGFAAHKTTVIPLATRPLPSAPRRNELRAAMGADPQCFVMAAPLALADASDPQWIALEMLAEMIHRGVPALLFATAPEAARGAVLEHAARLDVVASLHVLSPWADIHRAVAAADVVLLPSASAAAAWVALAAVDAGTPVIKSPRVRLPRYVTELPSAHEHIHPLARENLHTWLDTMEDFRPRATRTPPGLTTPAPVLPPLDAIAREYADLYRFLRSRRARRG